MLTLTEISERLDELAPFVDEYYRLQAAHAALGKPRVRTEGWSPAPLSPFPGVLSSSADGTRARRRRPA